MNQLPIVTNTATRHTLDFVKEFVPEKTAKILEIGCGKEDLALELAKCGYQVKTLAKSADILDFSSDIAFDAVLFSRSLHHRRPLETVFNKVKTLLGERGKILVEDFALEQVDAKTANWLYDLHDLVTVVSGTAPTSPTYSPGEGPLERWRKEHENTPSLHTGREMTREMERHFGTVRSMVVPYLYRYFEACTEKSPNGPVAVQKIFDWETKSIEKNLIQSVGLRMVAKKYFSYLK